MQRTLWKFPSVTQRVVGFKRTGNKRAILPRPSRTSQGGILINQEGVVLQERKEKSRVLVPVICCYVAKLAKLSEVKQQPFYLFTKAASQKFRWGPAGMACLCVRWENLTQESEIIRKLLHNTSGMGAGRM